MAGNFRVQIAGLDRVLARVTDLSRSLPDAVGQELYRDMISVMFASQAIVPYDQGDLHDSGEVDRPVIGGGHVSVTLHYGDANVDYALIQHEDLTLRHQQGGEAKFLETSLHQWADDGPKAMLQRALRSVARR